MASTPLWWTNMATYTQYKVIPAITARSDDYRTTNGTAPTWYIYTQSIFLIYTCPTTVPLPVIFRQMAPRQFSCHCTKFTTGQFLMVTMYWIHYNITPSLHYLLEPLGRQRESAGTLMGVIITKQPSVLRHHHPHLSIFIIVYKYQQLK